MKNEIDAYFKELVDIKRQLVALEARRKDLILILQPELELGKPITVDGACVYKLDVRDMQRLDKATLKKVLVSRFGEFVANDVISCSTVTSDAIFPTIVVRLPTESDLDEPSET